MPVEARDARARRRARRAAGRSRGRRSASATSASSVPTSRKPRGARAASPRFVPRTPRSRRGRRAQRVADRRAHLARMQQADDHRTSASTKAKNATRDDAVHREERRVEPAQVARAGRASARRGAAPPTISDADPVEAADVQPEPGGDEQHDRRQVQRRARRRTRRARRSASPRSAVPARGRRRRRRARRRGRSPATQAATAAPSAHACHGSSPLIAAQAPTGASPSTAPSQRWQSHVNRFRYG